LSGGKIETDWKLIDWAKEGVSRGAGELLFTSMNNDGVKTGFALDAIKILGESVNVPIIASGGAGCVQDFIDVFTIAKADAALAASIFHFNEVQIQDLKSALYKNNIAIRL
jgi:cyclase